MAGAGSVTPGPYMLPPRRTGSKPPRQGNRDRPAAPIIPNRMGPAPVDLWAIPPQGLSFWEGRSDATPRAGALMHDQFIARQGRTTPQWRVGRRTAGIGRIA